MLGSLTEKLDAHTQKAEALALLPLDSPSLPPWPGAGAPLPSTCAACGGSWDGGAGAGGEGAGGGAAVQAKDVALDSQPGRPRKPPRGAGAPTTLICCRATHEEVRRLR